MATKKQDFIEIEFTGRIKDSQEVFDTTDEQVAKDNDIWSKDQSFGPRTICLGETQILQGLDENLTGKEPGKELSFTLTPEQAFGSRDAR